MIAPVTTRPLAISEYSDWDALAKSAAEGTVYHDSRWLRAIGTAVGHGLVIMGFFVNGQLAAGLPLQVRRRGPLTVARRAFATPYANLVPHRDLGDREEHLVYGALERTSRGFSSFTLTGSPFVPKPPLGPRWRVAQRATFLLELGNEDKIWDSLGRPLQKKIRRAQRRGITVASGCEPSVFYDLYLATFSRRGLSPPFTRASFCRMLNTMTEAGLGRTYVATAADGRPCVARFVLFDHRRAYCALSGADLTVTKARVSELLVWEIIRDTCGTVRELDFVGANIPGITEFKRKFRGRLATYTEATCHRSYPERLLLSLHQRLTRHRRGGPSA